MKLISILAVFCCVCVTIKVEALSCLVCELDLCEPVKCWPKSVVKDPCGCCDVCAKQFGDDCGGPFEIDGKCDKRWGLVCQKKPFCGDQNDENEKGVCIPWIYQFYIKFFCHYRKIFSTKDD